MQIPENILLLIEKYQSGTATPEEKILLNKWYYSFDDSEVDLLTDKTEHQLGDDILKRVFETIRKEQMLVLSKPNRKWQIPAAAVVLILIASGIFFIFNSRSSKNEIARTNIITKPQPKIDIAPGGNKALLVLADGSTIILDSASNGTLTLQGNIKVEKLNNGLLTYTINGKQVTENDEAFYNTISTPRGGQYQVTLSDGTQVWLNAASSIRFPVVFTGKERKVEITGEAYFEVSPLSPKGGQKMPFIVNIAGKGEVEVLGTHFNVNAYDDEASIKTTLLEGLVKVSVTNSAGTQTPRFLQPGQQSGINKDGKISVQNNADVEEVMAWKNGRFQYNSADIKSILRQISRWYDVDVEYRGNVNLHFTGQLPRSVNASKVFEKLAMTGEVNFKIDGKRIIVSP